MGKINWNACIMELIGTFALCYVGGLSGGTLLNVALAHGLVLGFMIYAGASHSGSNFNPAVSLGLLLTGNMDWLTCLMYTLFQLLGGVLAGMLVYWWNKNCGCPEVSGLVNWLQAVLCELWGTFFLAIAVYGTAVDKRAAKGVFGMCIGGSLTMSVLGIGNYTGCALNPARYFGPMIGAALCGGGWPGAGNFWIYLVGPYGGAAFAMLLYKHVFYTEPEAVVFEVEAELEIKL